MLFNTHQNKNLTCQTRLIVVLKVKWPWNSCAANAGVKPSATRESRNVYVSVELKLRLISGLNRNFGRNLFFGRNRNFGQSRVFKINDESQYGHHHVQFLQSVLEQVIPQRWATQKKSYTAHSRIRDIRLPGDIFPQHVFQPN